MENQQCVVVLKFFEGEGKNHYVCYISKPLGNMYLLILGKLTLELIEALDIHYDVIYNSDFSFYY